jgi:hypothetical protein
MCGVRSKPLVILARTPQLHLTYLVLEKSQGIGSEGEVGSRVGA